MSASRNIVINPTKSYDYLVRRLFKNMLHKNNAYHIVFAKRGKSDRTDALQAAIDGARQKFREEWGKESNAAIKISADIPKDAPCLQVADYFLWALQRFYERGEDRYLAYLWPQCSLVQDIDDTRTARYGVYYTQKKPLTAAALTDRF